MPKQSPSAPSLAIEMWPVSRPIPYARNPRKISEQAISSVAGSIKEFGFKSPIIVDGEGVIINGHTRLKAALQLGMAEVPVIVARDLTPAQCQAYRLADNRVAEFTEWDADLLKIELDECPVDLSFADFDGLIIGEQEAAQTEDAATNQVASRFIVIVECRDENHQESIYNHLIAKGEQCRVSSI